MSQKPKGRPVVRATTKPAAGRQPPKQPPPEEYEEYEEYEEEPTHGAQQRRGTHRGGTQYRAPGAQSLRNPRQPHSAPTGYAPTRYTPPRDGRSYDAPRGRGRNRDRYYEPPPRRDLFPYVLGAVIGAVIVGVASLIFLLSSGGRSNGGSAISSGNPGSSQVQATLAPAVDAGGATAPAGQDPPRIPMADFKKLYDDPSKRPLIIDVRAKASYDEGHIKWAVSFPEADVDTRIAELPKDKLVVAYCQ